MQPSKSVEGKSVKTNACPIFENRIYSSLEVRPEPGRGEVFRRAWEKLGK